MSEITTSILNKINSPSDLKELNTSDLVKLSNELRQFIIDIVSINGGHFGASLGVVELSVALHFVFNTPYDQLVWDVGHQENPIDVYPFIAFEYHVPKPLVPIA